MTSKHTTNWEEEFDNIFTSDWWMGFITTDNIIKGGIASIKAFISEKIAEVLETQRNEWTGGTERKMYQVGYNDGVGSQRDTASWIERLRELYLTKQPDEDGYMTQAVTMQKQNFYLIGQRTLEEFITEVLAQQREELRQKIERLSHNDIHISANWGMQTKYTVVHLTDLLSLLHEKKQSHITQEGYNTTKI